MIFKCRFIKPNQSDWHNVSAESFEEAAQDFHGLYVPSYYKDRTSLVYVDRKPDNLRECIYFALIEIENHGQLIIRTYYTGIFRKGKERPDPTIESIAKGLGWTADPAELLEYWTGEESPEKALKNKIESKGLYKNNMFAKSA